MEETAKAKKYIKIGLKEAGEPFFSVIIATFNRAGLITRALESLVSQTEKDWEAVIIDDGSTDDTFNKLLPWLRRYPRITLIRQAHLGMTAAKNSGIRYAKGTFITFLDSDDEYSPEHLELRKKIIMQNPDAKFLYGGTRIIGNPFVPDRFDLSRIINLDQCKIGGTFIIERETAISLNGFRSFVIGGDADLFERAEKTNIAILEVLDPTYVYHHDTEDSNTNRLLEKL